MKHIQDTNAATLPPEGVNKWEVLRELGVAKRRMGITDRELTVLQALLSFHPETILGGNSAELIVFPSNAAICERLNGMPCSTMRRHLAGLVKAGLILRRDSANGKRFVRRHGEETEAYGFDLRPLLARFSDFCAEAEAQRAEDEAYERLRRKVSLMRRDLVGLADYGEEQYPDAPLWSEIHALAADAFRALRRNLSIESLADWAVRLEAMLDASRDVFECESEIMSTSDVLSEQHFQNSNLNPQDSEPCFEKAEGRNPPGDAPMDEKMPNIPLGLVLATCHEFQTFVPDKVRHWHHLVQAADVLRPMMGISPSAWQDAIEAMGPEEASVVLVAMLERGSEIKNPGGYLRHLSAKARDVGFSCGPMVMALTRKSAA